VDGAGDSTAAQRGDNGAGGGAAQRRVVKVLARELEMEKGILLHMARQRSG
jgi:hypothetical protein